MATQIPELETLYDEHASALFAFVLNLTRSEADTRDVLQDIFCRLASRPTLLSGVREVRPYLLRMAYRTVIDRHRRNEVRRRHAVEPVELFVPSHDGDETLFHEALARAMSELPAEQRAVVHLKLWQGLTFDEIARSLDLPPNTAASRYRYGLDKLRALLRPLYEEIR